jgi:hypothetical protein
MYLNASEEVFEGRRKRAAEFVFCVSKEGSDLAPNLHLACHKNVFLIRQSMTDTHSSFSLSPPSLPAPSIFLFSFCVLVSYNDGSRNLP